ncbi:MAG: amidohydrolase [Clostridia bacterium]|nr:amidohydrolase [Clostridia bacterium]
MLLTNLKIYTMEGEAVKRGFIHIKDKKIAAVGPMDASLPNDADTHDMSGLCACPGFVDSHCHLGMWEDSLGFEGDDGNEDTDPATPQLRAIDAVNPLDRGFSEALSGGVTTVITGPGSANPIGGQLAAIKTHGRVIDKMILRAPAAVKFALGENPKGVYNAKSQTPTTRMATAAIIRENLYKAQRYLADMERAHEDSELDEPEFDMKCESLVPLLKREIQAHFHAHRADDIFTALRIAREFSLDAVIVHATDAAIIARELSEMGARVMLGPVMAGRSKPELKNLSLDAAAKLTEAGVEFSIITDHPETPIDYLRLCAIMYVKAGLSRDEALYAITAAPARICGLYDRVGSLAAGKDADIVITEGEPMDFDAKVKYVFSDGALVWEAPTGGLHK